MRKDVEELTRSIKRHGRCKSMRKLSEDGEIYGNSSKKSFLKASILNQ